MDLLYPLSFPSFLNSSQAMFMSPYQYQEIFSLQNLPNELILDILSYCRPWDFPRLSRVCKTWNDITKTEAFWKKIANHTRLVDKPQKMSWKKYCCSNIPAKKLLTKKTYSLIQNVLQISEGEFDFTAEIFDLMVKELCLHSQLIIEHSKEDLQFYITEYDHITAIVMYTSPACISVWNESKNFPLIFKDSEVNPVVLNMLAVNAVKRIIPEFVKFCEAFKIYEVKLRCINRLV